MRKVKSTALLGAFVAVASVGVISHEAHGSQVVPPNNTPIIISKEYLPSQVNLQASVIPAVSLSSGTVTLKISGASFLSSSTYVISGASCTYVPLSNTDTLTFTSCTVNASSTYPITSVGSASSFTVTVPASSSSIVLSYSTNVGDASTATIAQVQQQLTVTPASSTTDYINPSSMSSFTNGSNSAANSVSIVNNALHNSSWTTYDITSSTMIFLFTGIPGSVSSVSAGDTAGNTSQSATPGNQSATISFGLSSTLAPFSSTLSSSDTITFTFSNSGNIQPGTIVLSSITGVALNNMNNYIDYPYLSTPQNFLTFAITGTQIYVPDALAPSGSNVIKSGYITISMPTSASIASISVLNNPSASCPAPSTSNGLLQSTSTTGVYYIDLSQLAQACTGLSASAWQSGVPLVINISGTNATPNNVTADAYAVFNGYLKRIPVNVLNTSNVNAGTAFSY